MKRTLIPTAAILACLALAEIVAACELMAFSFNEAVPARPWVAALWQYGAKNSQGWGVGYYRDQTAVVFKEPTSAVKSELADFLADYPALRARLLVAHVRRASNPRAAPPANRNTHPFVRELDGRKYVFAHNGTLKGFHNLAKLSRFKPLGATDSETMFCYLLEKIDEHGGPNGTPQWFQWLEQEFRALNGRGTMNCVLSDGTYLIVYRDQNGYNGLRYRSYQSPYGRVDVPNLSKKVNLGEIYPTSASGVIVATKPLSDEPWQDLTPGRLVAWKDGVQVFPKTSPIVPYAPNKQTH